MSRDACAAQRRSRAARASDRALTVAATGPPSSSTAATKANTRMHFRLVECNPSVALDHAIWNSPWNLSLRPACHVQYAHSVCMDDLA